MALLFPGLLLLTTALLLLILRLTRPAFRFAWLIAVAGALLGWIAVLFWQAQMPIEIALPSWQPATLFIDSPTFSSDRLTWPFAFSLMALTLTLMLTAGAREDYPNSYMWAGTLTLSTLGLLAVNAANPLTLVLVWTALDLLELITQLWSLKGASANERVVIAFSTRVLGSGLLVWANMVSVSAGTRLDFTSMPPQAGLYLILAAGLRLGVLPLHLPYPTESVLRRGFGTALRLVSAASSLVLLARIPPGSVNSPFAPFLLVLAAIAALYGGWMWLRAPDELAGRPYWLIGLAALAVSAALRANPMGAVAWSCALILSGGALFLVSIQNPWLNRSLLIGVLGLSGLPFTLTAGAWQSTAWFQVTLPLLVIAQALVMAGYVRHALRPGTRLSTESQPIWIRNVYPAGIGLLLVAQLVLGLWGWDGAFQIGAWPAGLASGLLTLALVWAAPRFRLLNPSRAHWIRPTSTWLDGVYRGLWDLYRLLGRLSQAVSAVLEGDGGLMWTLLFLVLFVSLMTQRLP